MNQLKQKFEALRITWFDVSLVISVSMMVAFIRVREQLPQLYPDEFLYVSALRDENVGDLPNYFYTLLYSPVTMCGDNTYLCAKGLNVGFFGILLILGYLIARTLVVPAYALLFTIFLGLGPLSGFTTLLTPEILFFVLTFLIILMFALMNTQTTMFWLLVAFLSSLLMLTKPHGIFMLGGLFTFLVFKAYKQRQFSLVAQHGLILLFGSYIMVVGLRWILSGNFMFNPLGARYSGAITRSEETIGGAQSQIDSSYFEPLSLFSTFIKQVVIQTSTFSLVLTAGIVIYILWVLNRKNIEVNDIEIIFTFTAISFIIGISLFSTLSIFWGELLQFRLMPRYYEHLLLLAPVFLLRRDIYSKRVLFLLISIIVFITFWLSPNTLVIFPFDSYFIGIWRYLELPLFILAIPGVIVALVAFKSARIARGFTFSFLVLYIVLFNFHFYLASDRFTTKPIPITETLAFRDYLNTLDSPRTIVIVKEINEFQKLKFWLPSSNVDVDVVSSITTNEIDVLKNTYKVIAIMNTVQVSDDTSFTEKLRTFSVIVEP